MAINSSAISIGVRKTLATLVTVLLLSQIAFIFVMWTFWRGTKTELRKQLRAKEVIQRVDSIRMLERELLLTAAESIPEGKGSAPPLKIVPHDFENEAATFSQSAPLLISLNQGLLASAKALDQAFLRLSKEESKEERKRSIAQCKSAMEKMDLLLVEMKSRFKDYHLKHAEEQMYSSTANFVNLALFLIGLAITIMVLTAAFARLIQRRINTLVLNTERIAAGEPMSEPLAGTDEFATVDAAFRRMNEALNAQSEILRLSEAKTRTIIEALPPGLMITSPEGKVESANTSAMQMLLLDTPEQVIDRSLSEFLVGYDTAQANGNGARTVQAVRSDKSVFPCDCLTKSFSSPDGQRLLVIFSDISEREKLRTLREEFVAVVSHEIRTPLTSVRAFLALLDSGMFGELNEQGSVSLKQMDSLTLRLMSLVNELVDAGRLELGDLSLQREQFYFQEVLESAVASTATLAKEHKVNFELTEDDTLLLGDKEKCVQVFINLLGNAVKYSPSGGAVRVRFSRESGDLIRVTVSDNGPGIPASEIANIFGRFAQVNQSGHRRQNSSGLGLYIAKEIIERQGGTIGVDSTEGAGSTFWFTVPVAPGDRSDGVPE
ncbi:MAG: PAS domain-containing protein [Candidatus Obscuribacterales bacterium]|nr:PAS domain-containing protein [Candidatus Obscuribacterales bacterium]